MKIERGNIKIAEEIVELLFERQGYAKRDAATAAKALVILNFAAQIVEIDAMSRS